MGWAALVLLGVCSAADPPGPGPFGSRLLSQPVPGAPRAASADGWKAGKLCDLSAPPYSVVNGSNSTEALRRAIDDCGDRPGGGTVLVPAGLVLQTASLFLRSNLTLRVEGALVGTATGDGRTRQSVEDAPVVYTRRNSLMTEAHAGLINGGRCLQRKQPAVGWDDCLEWSKLHNVVIEGGGLLDANGSAWYEVWAKQRGVDQNQRPMMLDLLWIDGLTIRDMRIRRPGYWTVHPTFCNNVVVHNNSIVTTGANTDGCDPDSSWNVLISRNHFSTGDDCIAIKAGRDWSGRMVNISTRNVLAEANLFEQGHGVSIGSETSGWVQDVVVRDSVLSGTNLAVRLKTMRGRGGGIQNVSYVNLSGRVVSAVQLTLDYGPAPPTNGSATPEIHDVLVQDLDLEAESGDLECRGLDDSPITGVVFKNVTVRGSGKQVCELCSIKADRDTEPQPRCKPKSHKT